MFSNNSFLCFCAVIMDSMYNNKELFLTQNSFSEEILQQDFSILVPCQYVEVYFRGSESR